MESIKEKLLNHKNYILALLILLILACTSFLLLIRKNNNISSSTILKAEISNDNTLNTVFKPYVQKLYDINYTLLDCINDSTIDTKNTVVALNNNISKLDSLKAQVSSLVIPNNNTPDAIPKFLLCVDSTKNLYKYCVEVLTYVNKLSSSEISSEILLLKETCLENYDELSPYGIITSFPEESLAFFDNLIGYLNTLDKLNKEQSIKDSKYNTFINNLTTATTNFSNLLEDLEPAINQIRSDNRSLDIILDDLDNKEETFEEIKKSFSYSSIPENCVSYYNSLNNIFELYSTYLSNMRIAIIYEESSTSYKGNKKNIDKNYSNAYSKLKDVKTSLDALLKSL